MIKTVFQLVMLTFTQPVSGFRYVIKTISAPTSVLLECLLLVAILSTSMFAFIGYVVASSDQALAKPTLMSPIVLTALMIIGLFMFAGIIFGAGKLFSSTATFSDCLAATVWWQSMLLAVAAIQLIAILFIPVSRIIVEPAGYGLTAYLTTYCIKAVHGFRSGFLVFLGVVAVVGIIIYFFSTLLMTSGLPQGGGG